jgi:ppGpp synthetase/RelA/SpoT-type nucleotidyltranferase
MAWATRHYSTQEIDAAGATLINPATSDEEGERAYVVINNWRSCHGYPLNTFQMTLRKKTRTVQHNILVAQRIKRLSSIQFKLRRFRKWLTLSEMQDIGGCRTVLHSLWQVDRLVDSYRASRFTHGVVDEDDYIRNPKPSGYRSYHLIYRYNNPKVPAYNGQKIEIQFRSVLQHAWATAVETVQTFTRQALKSSQGEEAWLRFFALMGTAHARDEDTPFVPNTPTNKRELIRELRHYARELDVEKRLETYRRALQIFARPSASRGARYYLLTLDPVASRVTVRGFKANQLQQAQNTYMAEERIIAWRPGADAVLVSVGSLAALRRAYPNYFLDTRVFINTVRNAMGT